MTENEKKINPFSINGKCQDESITITDVIVMLSYSKFHEPMFSLLFCIHFIFIL